MDDQGFDFRKPTERREPKRFEPPPWEREAFERLGRAKDEEPPVSEGGAAPGAGGPDGDRPAATVESGAGRRQLSEAEVLELLAGLAAEEPDARAPATQVTLGASIVLLPIGVLLVFWGMAALARAGVAASGAGIARTGAVTLLVFGAGFIGSTVWLLYRLMKQRGVL